MAHGVVAICSTDRNGLTIIIISLHQLRCKLFCKRQRTFFKSRWSLRVQRQST